jgi:hypothetical protein
MFRNLTIALLATTLLAAPVLAQTTSLTARGPATQPVKIPMIKPTATTTAEPVAAKLHKIVRIKKHNVKKVKVAKHVKHSQGAKHRIHFSGKPAMPSHQN